MCKEQEGFGCLQGEPGREKSHNTEKVSETNVAEDKRRMPGAECRSRQCWLMHGNCTKQSNSTSRAGRCAAAASGKLVGVAWSVLMFTVALLTGYLAGAESWQRQPFLPGADWDCEHHAHHLRTTYNSAKRARKRSLHKRGTRRKRWQKRTACCARYRRATASNPAALEPPEPASEEFPSSTSRLQNGAQVAAPSCHGEAHFSQNGPSSPKIGHPDKFLAGSVSRA